MITAKAVLSGDIVANSAVDDTLVLGGKAAGTLSGLGSTVTGFTTIEEDASAHWTLSGSISGTGTLDIGAGAKLTLDGAVSIASIAFAAGGNATLTLDASGAVTSKISGFGAGDVIDLPAIQATSLTFRQDTLTLFNASHQVVDTLLFTKGLSKEDFGLVAAGSGTEIIYAEANAPASASIGGGSVLADAMPALLHFGLLQGGHGVGV
jgi:hypothetical protein